MPSIKRAFLRKTLTLLGLQFLFTVILIVMGMKIESFKNFQSDHLYIFLIALLIEITLMIVIFCYKDTCREVPCNYIIFVVFTLSVSYILSFICARVEPTAVLYATVGTATLVFSLALYAYFGKTDFTQKIGLYISLPIVVGVIVIFVGGFLF